MDIPLVDNWRDLYKAGQAKVYPVGPKERDMIDELSTNCTLREGWNGCLQLHLLLFLALSYGKRQHRVLKANFYHRCCQFFLSVVGLAPTSLPAYSLVTERTGIFQCSNNGLPQLARIRPTPPQSKRHVEK